MMRRPPRSPLFPYTPLFRSGGAAARRNRHGVAQLLIIGAVAGAAAEAVVHRQGRTGAARARDGEGAGVPADRKSTRLNSSHLVISYAVFCLKKKQTWFRRRR